MSPVYRLAMDVKYWRFNHIGAGMLHELGISRFIAVDEIKRVIYNEQKKICEQENITGGERHGVPDAKPVLQL
jgi:hypothetical protein